MLARFRFAACAAVSCVGLAGSPAFAQEPTTETPVPVTENVVELQLTTEPRVAESINLYGIQAAEGQALAFAGDVVVEGTSQAEEPAGLWLGVQLATEIPPALKHHLGEAKGALVETVYPESPAAESGIESYDLILRLADSDIESYDKLVETMKTVEAKPIDVVILRGGEKKTISVTPRMRQPVQASATITADTVNGMFLNVPQMRFLPALGGAAADTIHHRMIQAAGPPASLPENVTTVKIRMEREGEELVQHVEVTTADGKTFKAANEEELKAFPAEIRAALPLPQNAAKFALRLDGVPSAPQQKRIIVHAVPGVPAQYIPPVAVPAPPQVATPQVAPAWVDIFQQPGAGSGANVTYQAVRVGEPPAELQELKTQVQELQSAIERIEKLLSEDK